MPDEPKKPVEPLLEAYKQKRRSEAGEPFVLHPADRRALQDEVARTLGAGERVVEALPPASNWWARWSAQVTAGLSFAVVLVLCSVVWLRQQPPLESSSDTSAARASFAESMPAVALKQAAPANEPLTAAADEKKSVQPDRNALTSDAVMQKGTVEKAAVVRDASPVLADRPARSEVHATAAAAAAPLPTPAPVLAKSPSAPVPAAAKDLAEYKMPADKEVRQEPAPMTAVRKAKPVDEVALTLESRSRPALAPAPSAPVASAKPASAIETQTAVVSTTNFLIAGAARDVTDEMLRANKRERVLAESEQVAAPTGQSQAFSQTSRVPALRRNFNSPPMPEVLQEFRVEQNGSQVHIIDADGSTYDGTLDPAPVAALDATKQTVSANGGRRKGAESELARRAAAVPITALRTYNFNVTGTNRTLQLRVQFNGQMELAPEVPQSSAQNNQAGAVSQAIQQVQGRATVGHTQFDLNAAPVKK